MYPNLPYPGHTWQITQHEISLDASIIYGLLSCASYFNGQSNVGPQITQLMINANLLTENIRDGRADAWRDYQQILPELGLMVSTRLQPQITIMPAGHMYISGAIGFSELILIQALRLQYPNGHKSQLSPRLRQDLESASLDVPQSVTELQASRGVLIKPGLLILKILAELHKTGLSAVLSVEEILAYLLPLKNNSEWDISFEEIKKIRQGISTLKSTHRHARRNVMAWMKLLSKSNVFSVQNGSISLTAYGIQILEELLKFCEEEEKPENYWIPNTFDRDEKISWFSHIGTIPFHAQSLITPDLNNQKYMEENYIGGIEEDTDEEEGVTLFNTATPDIQHSQVTQRNFNPKNAEIDVQEALKNLRNGTIRRQAKAALHDQIVYRLATSFKDQGAQVTEDRNSVDLFVKWPDETTTIFEVKTVTKRTLQPRMRLAVGQLLEYSYRIKGTENIDVERVAVFDLDIPQNAWQTEFLNDYLDIGLLSLNEGYFQGIHNVNSQTLSHWKEPGIIHK